MRKDSHPSLIALDCQTHTWFHDFFHKNEGYYLATWFFAFENLFYKYMGVRSVHSLIFFMSIKHYSSKAYYFGPMGVTTKHIVSYNAKGLFPFGISDFSLRPRKTLWRLSCSYHEIVSVDPCLHKGRHHWHGIQQPLFWSLLIASGAKLI